uniref:Uncharacterized protein n=1 Tax=Oryza nivara TaxID=4536 RepID=A0A0E0GYB1_ORYNI
MSKVPLGPHVSSARQQHQGTAVAIATHLSKMTDNENTHLKKRLIQMGFDPMTHRPRTDFFTALPQLIALATLRDHLAGTTCGGGGADHAGRLWWWRRHCHLGRQDAVPTSAASTIASVGSGGGGAMSAHDADAALAVATCSSSSAGSSVPITATAIDHSSGQTQAPCAFSEAPVITSDDVEANLRLLGCGVGADAFACHGGSLPLLADLFDVTTTTNLLDWCSATGSSRRCPFLWLERGE